MSNVKAPADSIFLETHHAAEALQDLFDISRLEHLSDLEDVFSDSSSAVPFDIDDQEDDRTITRDEFVKVTTGADKGLDRASADQLFSAISKKFGPGISSGEVVGVWQMAVEGRNAELPASALSAVQNLLSDSRLKVTSKKLEIPNPEKANNPQSKAPQSLQIGTVSIHRRSVPKGSGFEGLDLNDGDKGAWRPVHRLHAVMKLNTDNFKMTMEELARLVSCVDLYGEVLSLSNTGKLLKPEDFTGAKRTAFEKADCSHAYDNTFTVPKAPGNGYDVICMLPTLEPVDGAIELTWTTRKNGVDLNQFANEKNRPTYEGDTWGKWRFTQKGNEIRVDYHAILDMPGLPAGTGNAGTGTGVFSGLVDAVADGTVSSATTSLLEDTVKMGIVFEAIKRHLAGKGAPNDFDNTVSALRSFYRPLKTKDLTEILKVMPAKVDAHLRSKGVK